VTRAARIETGCASLPIFCGGNRYSRRRSEFNNHQPRNLKSRGKSNAVLRTHGDPPDRLTSISSAHGV
jgi:hypothetical protein